MSNLGSIQEGSVISDTYRVTRLIAEGGFGSVWRADHLRLPGKRVAIKVLQRDIAEDEETLLRFRREAEITSRLGHPNIVEVHDFNMLPDGSPYLVLEYLQGESLRQAVNRGAMDYARSCRLLRQVGSALRAAHKNNIIHRDLKPDNIFLCCDGPHGEEYAKVLDFGISKIRGSNTIKTHESAMLGTPQYMAPEQVAGSPDDIDARTDIFALGVIAYEMLSGRMAFEGDSIPSVVYKVNFDEPAPIRELAPEIPEHTVSALSKAIAKDKSARFETVADFIEALTGQPLPRESQLYKSVTTPASDHDYESFRKPSPTPVTKPAPQAERRVSMGLSTRRKKLLALSAALLLALMGIIFALIWTMPAAPSP